MFVSLVVATAVGAQYLFAHQPEKNFWEARRQARRVSSLGLLSYGPASVRSGSSSPVEFPVVAPLHSRFYSFPSVSTGESRLSKYVVERPKLLSSLPPKYGTVRKILLGEPRGRGPVVIHIQDVHGNAEAQWNIRQTVAGLLESGEVDLMALEGASDSFDLQPFVDFPQRKAVEIAAEYLLRENKISGPIHAALTARGRLPTLVGIEDPIRYDANIQAVKESLPKRENIRALVKACQQDIEIKKKKVFSSRLRDLDLTVEGYREGAISLGRYAEALAQVCKGETHSSVVTSFLKAIEDERTLDLKQVDLDRFRLINDLSRPRNVAAHEDLLSLSFSYRSGEARVGEFYAGLKEMCRRRTISFADYPALDAYIRYVLEVSEIEAESLVKDITLLERRAYSLSVTTPEEKDVVESSRQAWLTEKLVDFSLTPAEWEEYLRLSSLRKLSLPLLEPAENDGTPALGRPSLRAIDLSSFESFYREAKSRDGAMVNNLLTALRCSAKTESSSSSSSSAVAVLITGGFHAEGIARALVREGVTVVSFVPKIEKIETAQGATYLNAFTQEKTPLDRLFEGEKLFLPTPPLSNSIRHVLLPALVLTIVLLVDQMDVSTLYTVLGGVGTFSVVICGKNFARTMLTHKNRRAAMEVSFLDGKIDKATLESRIKIWDPLLETIFGYVPFVLLGPYVLSVALTTFFHGGLVMLVLFDLFFGMWAVYLFVPFFIEMVHEQYPSTVKEDLLPPGRTIGYWTLVPFLVTLVLLSTGVTGIQDISSWVPLMDGRVFILSSFVGAVFSLSKHMDHNMKTFPHFLRSLTLPPDGDLLPLGLSPLSFSAARLKLKKLPEEATYRVLIPSGMEKIDFLNMIYNRVLDIQKLAGEVKSRHIRDLLNDLKEFNPQYFEKDREKPLKDTEIDNDFDDVVNSSIFIPLDAHSLGFRGVSAEAPEGWTLIDRQSWVGRRVYDLDQEIWWAHAAKSSPMRTMGVAHGFGVYPPDATFHEKAKRIMEKFSKNKNSERLLRETNLKDLKNALALIERLTLIEFMTISALPINGKLLTVKGKLANRSSENSGLMVTGKTQGLITAMSLLLDLKKPVYAIWLWMNFAEENVPEFEEFYMNIHDRLSRLTAQQPESPAQLAKKMLEIVVGLYSEMFYSNEERYAQITGHGVSPSVMVHNVISVNGNHSIPPSPSTGSSTPPVRIHTGSAASITTAREIKDPTVKIVAEVNSVQAQGNPLAALVYLLKNAERGSIEELVSLGKKILREALPETFDSPMEPGPMAEAIRLLNEVSTARSDLAEKVLASEDRQRAHNRMAEIRQLLPLAICDEVNSAILEKLIDGLVGFKDSLELSNLEVNFLRAYKGVARTGQMPSNNNLMRTGNLSLLQVLESHDRVVRLLDDWHLFPILDFEDEKLETEPGEAEPEEGTPQTQWDKHVLIHEDYFSHVAGDANAKKILGNSVNTLIKRVEATGGRVLKCRNSEHAGLGIHQISSNRHDLFFKIMNGTIVLLWYGTLQRSHANVSGSSNTDVDTLVAQRANNLLTDVNHYVLINSDFSSSADTDISSLLSGHDSSGLFATNGGRATGWVGIAPAVGVAWGIWFLWERWKRKGGNRPNFVQSFVLEWAEHYENWTNNFILGSLVVLVTAGALSLPPWMVGWLSVFLLSPPIVALAEGGIVIFTWFALFLVSHVLFKGLAQSIMGDRPSLFKALRVLKPFSIPLGISILVGLLVTHPPLLTSAIIPLLPGLIFSSYVKNQHQRLNENDSARAEGERVLAEWMVQLKRIPVASEMIMPAVQAGYSSDLLSPRESSFDPLERFMFRLRFDRDFRAGVLSGAKRYADDKKSTPVQKHFLKMMLAHVDGKAVGVVHFLGDSEKDFEQLEFFLRSSPILSRDGLIGGRGSRRRGPEHESTTLGDENGQSTEFFRLKCAVVVSVEHYNRMDSRLQRLIESGVAVFPGKSNVRDWTTGDLLVLEQRMTPWLTSVGDNVVAMLGARGAIRPDVLRGLVATSRMRKLLQEALLYSHGVRIYFQFLRYIMANA